LGFSNKFSGVNYAPAKQQSSFLAPLPGRKTPRAHVVLDPWSTHLIWAQRPLVPLHSQPPWMRSEGGAHICYFSCQVS
jgi:hypothetical protein